jgi:hypothetical protein
MPYARTGPLAAATRARIRRTTSIDYLSLVAWSSPGFDWEAAVAALSDRELPCSRGERRILMLSVSLATSILVDLRDAVTGIDDRNVQRLLTAIPHASGK